ncbi:TetR family transcriptional regulator [Streptomyces sporangiiformans]|uniref:TetR family transcriptional regulator n=2 Tax=Streptomyces sporangiiformans TaxID=2315329 RepID=A0A505D881_9ACTN|nr:TetR family transcriptional regulator [Streptomyces sporangiiformans]
MSGGTHAEHTGRGSGALLFSTSDYEHVRTRVQSVQQVRTHVQTPRQLRDRVLPMPIRPATHRASGQARRTALLEAAIEVIAEGGVGKATHRSIAARAGMPLSTTSYFFSSLDDLIAAALQVVADRISARVEEALRKIDEAALGPEESIEPFLEQLLSTPQSELTAQFEIYLECARRPQLQATAHQIMASIERAAEASLRALGISHATRRAPMVVAMLDGFALHRRAWPRGEADRRMLREALSTLLRTFAAQDSAKG